MISVTGKKEESETESETEDRGRASPSKRTPAPRNPVVLKNTKPRYLHSIQTFTHFFNMHNLLKA